MMEEKKTLQDSQHVLYQYAQHFKGVIFMLGKGEY